MKTIYELKNKIYGQEERSLIWKNRSDNIFLQKLTRKRSIGRL